MATKRARILVVDDERFFREAIREALEGAGPRMRDGRQRARGSRARPGKVTSGSSSSISSFPGIDGIEVLRRLREMHPALRVVILSAHTDQEIVLEALRLGASDYLAKPLHDEELVLAVKRALETHAIAAGWDKLRARLSLLESKLGELVRESSGGRASRGPPDPRGRDGGGRARRRKDLAPSASTRPGRACESPRHRTQACDRRVRRGAGGPRRCRSGLLPGAGHAGRGRGQRCAGLRGVCA